MRLNRWKTWASCCKTTLAQRGNQTWRVTTVQCTPKTSSLRVNCVNILIEEFELGGMDVDVESDDVVYIYIFRLGTWYAPCDLHPAFPRYQWLPKHLEYCNRTTPVKLPEFLFSTPVYSFENALFYLLFKSYIILKATRNVER